MQRERNPRPEIFLLLYLLSKGRNETLFLQRSRVCPQRDVAGPKTVKHDTLERCCETTTEQNSVQNSREIGGEKKGRKKKKKTLSIPRRGTGRGRAHDIEPRDGPADTELSGPAIASSHGRVKARGAARGTGRTPTSHEFEQERGRQKDSGAERESESPRSREKKESLTAGPVHGERTIQKDERRGCGRARTMVLLLLLLRLRGCARRRTRSKRARARYRDS